MNTPKKCTPPPNVVVLAVQTLLMWKQASNLPSGGT